MAELSGSIIETAQGTGREKLTITGAGWLLNFIERNSKVHNKKQQQKQNNKGYEEIFKQWCHPPQPRRPNNLFRMQCDWWHAYTRVPHHIDCERFRNFTCALVRVPGHNRGVVQLRRAAVFSAMRSEIAIAKNMAACLWHCLGDIEYLT